MNKVTPPNSFNLFKHDPTKAKHLSKHDPTKAKYLITKQN